MEKAEKKQLELQEEEAVKVKGMLRHPGWTDVIEPKIRCLRESCVRRLIGGSLDDTLIRNQEAVKIIDYVFSTIDSVLKTGTIASQQLEEEKVVVN